MNNSFYLIQARIKRIEQIANRIENAMPKIISGRVVISHSAKSFDYAEEVAEYKMLLEIVIEDLKEKLRKY